MANTRTKPRPKSGEYEYVYSDLDTDAPSTKPDNSAPVWADRYGITELWSEIKPGLHMGGTGDHDKIIHSRDGDMHFEGMIDVYDQPHLDSDDFDAVVTMYAWARPVDWFVEEYRFGIFDSHAMEPDLKTIKEIVVWAHTRWKDDKKVLIRCQAGLSRSGFITALVLVRDGMDLDDAIKLIRQQRSPYALSMNGTSSEGLFTKAMIETPVEYWRD